MWVLAFRWRNHYFARNKEAFPCVRPWTKLSASPRTVHFKCMSIIDHVDQAAPRAPGRWTMARPRKGVFIFLCVIRRHFLACEDIAGGSDLSAGGTFF